MDLAKFKEAQKESWAYFSPMETHTTPTAARLVKHAGVTAGQRVLDVACGTGVVAITAARAGALVTALDLTPQLLEHARENARLASVEVEFHEGDVEQLPFENSNFDVVVSQYGHIFAPRPEVALAEMLRVLKPGGTIAFSTWPPDFLVGRTFLLVGRYVPPPPQGVPSPMLWGDPNVIRQRFGSAVKDIFFAADQMLVPALSPAHYRNTLERAAGPVLKLVQTLTASDPSTLAEFRGELEKMIAEYHEDNILHQHYLLTRATKL